MAKGSAFVAGLLFGVGLILAGMTVPDRVVGFLDLFGDWDPTLMFVMGGAIAVHLPLRRWALARGIECPAPRRPVDPKVITGAALFGMGWGIAGLCPGPAVVSLASGSTSVLWFVLAMMSGMVVYRRFQT